MCFMKRIIEKVSAKRMVSILDKVLSVEANTSSCTFVYQPKAPNELKQYTSIPIENEI